MPNDKSTTVPELRPETNGVYYAFWSEGRRSKRKSMGTRNQAQATARFAQWLLIDGTQQGGDVAYTIADLWTVYDRKHVQTDAVMPLGRATIGAAWKNLRPHFGHLLADQLTHSMVAEYVAKRGRTARPATIRREVATLLAAVNFCASAKGGKLVKDVEKIELPPDSPPRDRWLTMPEMQRLLTAAAEGRRGTRLSRGERFLWLALFTAARKQAILDLTWDRVDFDTNTIHYDVPGRRITKKRRAAVTIATQLRPILERAYVERTGPVVMDNGAAIWATVQFIARKAGFGPEQVVAKGAKPMATGISPHVLRHTAATHMARRGVALWMIAQVLGNTTAMVEKVYAKWVPENAAGTVDLISSGVLEDAE